MSPEPREREKKRTTEGGNPKSGVKGGPGTAAVAPVTQVMMENGGERRGVQTTEVQ